jgi:hypothetical protein
MGETTPYRVATFRYIADILCNTFRRSHQIHHSTYLDISLLPYKFNISRELLRYLAKSSLIEERLRIVNICKAISTASESDFQMLHEATTNVCDDRRRYIAGGKQECEYLFTEVYSINSAALSYYESISVASDISGNRLSTSLNTDTSVSRSASEVSRKRVFFLDQMTKAQYDRIYFSSDDARNDVIRNFTIVLNRLSDSLDMTIDSNQRYIRHKKGIMYGSLAKLSSQQADWGSAINHAFGAIDEMGVLLDKMNEHDPDFSGYVVEYIDSVAILARAYIGIEDYTEALKWANIALSNARTFYREYNGEERIMARKLGKYFLTVASLSEYLEDFEGATKSIIEMKIMLDSFGLKIITDLAEVADSIMSRIAFKNDLSFD